MRVTPTPILTFLAKTQKNDSHFSLKGILTSKLILTFHFKSNMLTSRARWSPGRVPVPADSPSAPCTLHESLLSSERWRSNSDQVVVRSTGSGPPCDATDKVATRRGRSPSSSGQPPRPPSQQLSNLIFQRLKSRSHF